MVGGGDGDGDGGDVMRIETREEIRRTDRFCCVWTDTRKAV
jgi:hypothetical protein